MLKTRLMYVSKYEKIILEHGDALAWVKQARGFLIDFVSGLTSLNT